MTEKDLIRAFQGRWPQAFHISLTRTDVWCVDWMKLKVSGEEFWTETPEGQSEMWELLVDDGRTARIVGRHPGEIIEKAMVGFKVPNALE